MTWLMGQEGKTGNVMEERERRRLNVKVRQG